MIPLVDAHAHYGGEGELHARRNVLTMFCGTDPEDARRVLELPGENVLACCALHPWKAGQCAVEDMVPAMERCAVIGEIGLDNLWTDVDMELQRKTFVRQLELALEWNKPMVLHTKGMEWEVARIVSDYPIRKLVHWYSCMEHLDDYLRQDCYFTVGPDFAANPAVQQVIRRVPLNRLLTETDGMEAVGWALGREADAEEIEAVLAAELRAIARAKRISEEAARRAVYDNFQRFISKE